MYTNTRSLTPPVSARAHPILTPNDTATPTPATPRPSHPHPQWREPTPPYSNKVALNNARGEVVGINFQIETTDSGGGYIGLAFAIPIDRVKRELASLEKG